LPSFVLSAGYLALILASPNAGAQVNVWTYHNNNFRTGANTNETILNLTNVNSTSFGRLFTNMVDGCVYAQPLYVPGVAIPRQGTHNILIIATEHNTVYAFDADVPVTRGGLLWMTNLGPSAVTSIPGGYSEQNFGTRYPSGSGYYTDIIPEVGITGTPVIDTNTGTLYVDAFTGIVGATTNYFHTIHALNITNGSEQSFSPVVVTASVAGTGVDSSGGKVTFNPKQENERPALTLAGGIVYFACAGYADTDPYHGWVIGFNATNLVQMTNYVFCTDPNASTATFGSHAAEAGIWMGGGGLAVDSNTNLYFEVGNGSFSATNNSGNVDFGDSFMKLSTTNGLKVADYFAPWDQASFQANDTDVGSGGLVLLPDQPGAFPHELLGAGKEGEIYLINRDQMTTNNGHFDSTNFYDFVVQTNIGMIKPSFDTPAYFNNRIYYGAEGDSMKIFLVTNGLLSTTAVSTSSKTFPNKGSTPSVSANGTNNGIVWALQMPSIALGAAGTLVAYNATNFTTELYNSTQAAGNRDQLGAGVKFAVPTVADGEVFVGSSNSVSVFGMLAGTFSFGAVAYSVKETITNLTITVNRVGGTNGAVQVSYATVAGGTAQNGVDYTSVSGALNWTNGETASKSFSVPVLGNYQARSNVTVNLALSSPTNIASALGTQPTALLTINMATPIVSVALTATAITYGQTLASSTPSELFTNGAGATVPGTLSFVNPAQMPKAGITNVPVIFTPTDAADYSTVTNLVGVTVNLATPIVSVALTATVITYGQTLSGSTPSESFTNTAGITVPGTLSFVNPTQVPKAGITNVPVIFTPTDTADYNTVTNTVGVTVNLATPILSVALTATAITFGQTLASSTPSEAFTNTAGVTVPGTLAFVNPSQVAKAGITNVPVIFTPTDAADYSTVTNLVGVTVNLATPIVSVALTATAITYGQTLASSTPSESFTNAVGVAVPGTLTFVNPAQVPKAGITNVPVIFTPTDTADYNMVTNTVAVTVTKTPPLLSGTLTATAITYGQTLASSTPSESFTNAAGVAVPGTLAFVNPAQVPKAGTTNVPVIFTPTDAVDYNTVTNTVGVTVNMATPIVSVALTATAITYGQTLASSTPSESFTNGAGVTVPGTLAFVNPAQVPKAGITNVPVIFTPTDTADYNRVTNTVGVMVNRITLNFTGLISLTNNYGVTNIILTGELSGSGPVYPASGEIVSATINSIAVNGTQTNSTGGFWINYNDPSLATDNASNSPYTITYAYAGNAGTGLASASDSSTSLTIIQLPYDTWKLAYFGTNANNPAIAGNSADPEHDGIVNLLAYAYAFNPLVANTNPFTASLAGKQFQLHFPRNTSASDITLIVQASTNLTAWSNLMTYAAASGWVTNTAGTTVAESPTNGVPPTQHVNVTVTSSTNVMVNAKDQFLRLEVHP
jgi:hypothetical protein